MSIEQPCVLICAGLDPSGGAGLIADVRTVTAMGARAVGVITASTVQNTTGVLDGAPMDPKLISDQLAFLLSDVEVRAVKIGMIGSAPVAQAIGSALAQTAAPVVWDPVMYPSRGDLPMAAISFSAALALLRDHLTLLTPNAAELAFFADRELRGLDDAVAAGRELATRIGCAVLVKGGHFDGPEAIDVLLEGEAAHELRGPRIPAGEHVHGTGCALATAIASQLAIGADLRSACHEAKRFVATRIASPVRPGAGAGAIW